jgi:hypothetical protein
LRLILVTFLAISFVTLLSLQVPLSSSSNVTEEQKKTFQNAQNQSIAISMMVFTFMGGFISLLWFSLYLCCGGTRGVNKAVVKCGNTDYHCIRWEVS